MKDFFRKISITRFFKRRSKKPWLDVVHSGFDEDGMIRLELDWNTAFIQELLKAGFNGKTEEDLVRQYLNSITQRVEKEFDE